MFSIGFNNIGMLLLYTVLGFYFIKKYSDSKNKKYILFSLICGHLIVKDRYILSINGIAFRSTIYADIFNCIIAVSIAIIGYQIYKQRKFKKINSI